MADCAQGKRRALIMPITTLRPCFMELVILKCGSHKATVLSSVYGRSKHHTSRYDSRAEQVFICLLLERKSSNETAQDVTSPNFTFSSAYKKYCHLSPLKNLKSISGEITCLLLTGHLFVQSTSAKIN